MNKTIHDVSLATIFALMCLVPASTAAQKPVASTPSGADGARGFSAYGRIEGATPTVRMAFTVPGEVREVAVRAATRVAKGRVLMSLSCDDRAAAESAAVAELADARAQSQRLKAGARAEERAVAGLQVAQAEVDEAAAKSVMDRFEGLRSKGGVGGNVSELQYTQSVDVWKSARARLAAQRAQETLITAAARAEDLQSADARVAGAASRVAAARAEQEKCLLRAPSDGVVLKTFLERGDAVFTTAPQVALTFAETARIRVRAEVDERFVERVRLGQAVTVASDFNAQLKLRGKLVSREAQMGRRTILSVDPADKNDRDVLEVLIELDRADETAASQLPVGYRVNVRF
jgi:HlyD family secretion protein